MEKVGQLTNQVIERCSSTNTLAKELAEKNHPHGTWISCRIQEAGRGRLGRKWESLEGNLFLSVVVRVQQASLWSWIPVTAAVAVVQCLRIQFPGNEFLIKWPNDIWLDGKKLGGILCEGGTHRAPEKNEDVSCNHSSHGNLYPYIVVGIGLNCTHAPEGLEIPATALTLHKNLTDSSYLGWADILRPLVLSSLLNEIDILRFQGPSLIQKKYNDWAVFAPGTKVEWGTPLQAGYVQGLGLSSELLVISPGGNVVSLFAEDVNVKIRPHLLSS